MSSEDFENVPQGNTGNYTWDSYHQPAIFEPATLILPDRTRKEAGQQKEDEIEGKTGCEPVGTNKTRFLDDYESKEHPRLASCPFWYFHNK
jgi:hypothetical protein